MNRRLGLASAVLALFAFCSANAVPHGSPRAAADAAQVIITATGSHGNVPKLTREDVSVREDRKNCTVINLAPFNTPASPLQLAILIDSSSTHQLGSQFDEISRFIDSLPPNATIALAYSMSGSARIEQPFTADRTAFRKALHLPIGPAAGNTSIYAALSDLIRKWPSSVQGRREVLLISDGVDITYGFFETQPYQNPGLQSAIRDAQQNRVVFFSIFVSSGRATRNNILNLNGQGSLSELTSNTGGYSFFQGMQTPVSFRPFLDDLQRMLSQQYLLTFRPAAGSGFHSLKVSTEASGVKLLAPKHIYIPAAE